MVKDIFSKEMFETIFSGGEEEERKMGRRNERKERGEREREREKRID